MKPQRTQPPSVPPRASVPTPVAEPRPRAKPARGTTPPPKSGPTPTRGAPSPVTRRHRVRRTLVGLGIALVALSAFAFIWVEANLQHVPALSGAPNTPGNTYLIVGSDSREGWDEDGTEGARTDTIILLHQPEHGPVALISIPRDSYVDIPGHDANKINAAFAFGGPELLVKTVEGLSGLTVDAYIEVGFTGVVGVVDALGGVELCYAADSELVSGLAWKAGCHVADGAKALAFARMRHGDPQVDIGRAARQRHVVARVTDDIFSPGVLLNPLKAYRLADAGLNALTVSEGTGAIDLAAAALAFREASHADAVTGTPPIATLDHRVEGAGSTVLLDPETSAAFWAAIANGEYAPGTAVGGIP